MIGVWGDSAQWFLIATTAATLSFGLPIFFAPFRWAEVFGWRLPKDRDLALYFGRCLGALALVLAGLMLRGAITGDDLQVTYLFILGTSGMMVLVHVWGALEKVQPVSENIEIGFYGALFVLALMFYPG